MLEALIEADKELFLTLNQLHAPWLDFAMALITGRELWLPLYVYVAFLMVRTYGWGSGLLVLLGAGLAVAFGDIITSHLMKPYFGRLRPSHEPTLAGQIHLVTGRGGRFGFASGHAATTFAFATFAWLSLRQHWQGMAWLFAWSSLVAYSRIYVGKHYPLDIIVGGLLGVLIGHTLWWAFRRWVHPRLPPRNATPGWRRT